MNEEYYLLNEDEQSGPFTLEQIGQMSRDGQLGDTVRWSKAGFPQWKPLKELPDMEETPPPLPTSRGKVFLSRSGVRTGPYDSSQIRTMWQGGLIAVDTLVWREGMTDWEPAIKFFADAGPGPRVMVPMVPAANRNRGLYIVLALIFGCLGIHNFYAGYYGRGIVQFLITALLGWIVVGIIITGIWAILEAICVTDDGTGMPMS